MNSLPLSEWKLRMRNGNCASMASSTGMRKDSLICSTDPTTSHCDLVHRVDVIHPLHPVLVPLMHRVDAYVSGASLRLRFPPLADGHARRPRHLILDMPLAVRATPP